MPNSKSNSRKNRGGQRKQRTRRAVVKPNHDEPFTTRTKPFPSTVNITLPPIHRKLFFSLNTNADKTETVFSAKVLFNQKFNTHVFSRCTIHKVEIWTNTVPNASLNQFPIIEMQFFVPGAAAGNWHQNSAPSLESRAALAIVNSRNYLSVPWTAGDTFAKVKTNVSICMLAVSAVFEV